MRKNPRPRGFPLTQHQRPVLTKYMTLCITQELVEDYRRYICVSYLIMIIKNVCLKFFGFQKHEALRDYHLEHYLSVISMEF